MKNTTGLPPTGDPAGITGSGPHSQILCWALAGFGLGVVSASAYLLLGGEYLLFIPRWAEIVFYPGFLAGTAAYDLGLRQDAPKVVGVLAVGFAYALLALLVRLAWSTVRKRTAKGPPDRASCPSSRSGMPALLLLFAAVSAQAEGYGVPDHIWVLGLDSHHPVGVAWDNPDWAGVHSSIQIYLCFGMQHPFEIKLPVVVLGLLMLGGFVALVLGLARRFKQRETLPR